MTFPALVLGIPSLVYVICGIVFARRLRAKRFSKRNDTDLDKLYESEFYSSLLSRDRFKNIWRDLATALSIDPLKLEPNDSFDHQLKAHAAPFPLINLNDDIDRYIESICGDDRNKVRSVSSVKTLRDLVIWIGENTR